MDEVCEMKNIVVAFILLLLFVLNISTAFAVDLVIYRGDQRGRGHFYPHPVINGRGLLLAPSAYEIAQGVISAALENPQRAANPAIISYNAAQSAIGDVQRQANMLMRRDMVDYEESVNEHVEGLTGYGPYLSFSLNPQIAGGYSVGGADELDLNLPNNREVYSNALVYRASAPSNSLTVARDALDGDRAFSYPPRPYEEGYILIPEAELLITGGVEITHIFTNIAVDVFMNRTPVDSLFNLFTFS
jgi:hypothetical protein